jgi:hypothetical protein
VSAAADFAVGVLAAAALNSGFTLAGLAASLAARTSSLLPDGLLLLLDASPSLLLLPLALGRLPLVLFGAALLSDAWAAFAPTLAVPCGVEDGLLPVDFERLDFGSASSASESLKATSRLAVFVEHLLDPAAAGFFGSLADFLATGARSVDGLEAVPAAFCCDFSHSCAWSPDTSPC